MTEPGGISRITAQVHSVFVILAVGASRLNFIRTEQGALTNIETAYLCGLDDINIDVLPSGQINQPAFFKFDMFCV